jgi:hypothetical protein
MTTTPPLTPAAIAVQIASLSAALTTATTPAASGMMITTPTQVLVDGAGINWEISAGGQLLMNGTACPGTAMVVGVLYYLGEVYQTNSNGGWWMASNVSGGAAGVTWGNQITDPRKVPPVTPTLPPEAAGMSLKFSDGGYTNIGNAASSHDTWQNGLWYNAPAPASCFQVSEGTLTMSTLADGAQVALTSMWHDTTGGFFAGSKPFYMEANIFAAAWTSAWGLSVNHARNVPKTSNPLTWCAEFDGVETDPTKANQLYTTLHENTSGQGQPAAPPDSWTEGGPINTLNPSTIATPLIGKWHKLGWLYQPSGILSYVDGVKLPNVLPFFPSSPQDLFFILSVAGGGLTIGGGPGPVTAQFGPFSVYQ